MKTTRIFEIQIPIVNYDGDGIFYQSLYFDKAPTKQNVLDTLNTLHTRDSEYLEYLGNWESCISAVNQIPDNDWQKTGENMVHTNTFVKVCFHENCGIEKSFPFTWKTIKVFEVV